MKTPLFLGAAAFCIAGTANATGGLSCKTAGPRPTTLALVVSHTVVPTIVSARLHEAGRNIAVVIAQSWLDPDEIRVDLTDSNAMRHEARLRASWRPASRSYDGSLWRNGKRRWVRCRES